MLERAALPQGAPTPAFRAPGATNGHGPGAPQHAELLSRSARGDQAAFAQLYDDTSPCLFDLVLRVVGDQATAEEVTEQAYLTVWQQSARYTADQGSASSWIITTAYRAARAHCVSRRATISSAARWTPPGTR